MGDRTAYTLTLPASLPDDAIVAAAAAFYDDGDDVTGVAAEVRSNREHQGRHETAYMTFVETERTIGEEIEAAQAVWMALMQAGHRAPFMLWADPYMSLGTLVRWHPVLGPHEVDCDGDGTPRITDTELANAMTKGAEALGVLVDLAGLDWEHAWQAWLNQNPSPANAPGQEESWEPRAGDHVLFHSIYQQHKHLNGQVVQVEQVVTDPEEVDDLVLPVYRVRLPAGEVIDAWPEELHPHGLPVVPGPDALAPNDWWGQPRTYERVPVLPDSYFRRVGSRASAA